VFDQSSFQTCLKLQRQPAGTGHPSGAWVDYR
jgi:hypothetical protein